MHVAVSYYNVQLKNCKEAVCVFVNKSVKQPEMRPQIYPLKKSVDVDDAHLGYNGFLLLLDIDV